MGAHPSASRTARRSAKETVWFTPAEARVLELLPTYLTLDGIADRLGVRRSTIKTHVVGIYKKLGVKNRAQAIEQAQAGGFFKPVTPARTGTGHAP